jgi:hypothetical protein
MTKENEDMSKIKLVFIHLGNKPPAYLWTNLKRCHSLFNDVQVVFISDSFKAMEYARALNVSTWCYRGNKELERVFDSMSSDRTFRKGFWRYSLERLFALTAFHSEHQDSSVIHIESDILLFDDFPWDNFYGLRNLMWMPFNLERDVASIIYSPSANRSKWLERQMLNSLKEDPDLSDMMLLRKIAEINHDHVEYFPMAESEDSPILQEWTDLEYRKRVTSSYPLFDGVMDGATIGMWLTGQDPRNNKGSTIRYKNVPESAVNTELLKGKVVATNSGVSIGHTRVLNLHIHSKNRKLLSRQYLSEIGICVSRSQSGKTLKQFSYWGFFELAKGYVLRRLNKIREVIV